ncbi:MAG: hypothetical protein VKP70_08670 [Cyanobacteriota bacterium]|nr:hypothetical protein [Cyanobacteriota bacterium]
MGSPSAELPPRSLEALRALIAQRQGEDPLAGTKLGSKLALDLLLEQLTTERGVHAETLVALAGVLAGQSVQASLWAEARLAGDPRVAGLRLVECRDGTRYLVGDPLNQGLLEGWGSPWQVLAEAARQEGCSRLPSGEELLLEGLKRLGTPSFGQPGVPASHAPQPLAPGQETTLWRWFHPLRGACCQEPRQWPLLHGLLAARSLRLVRPVLEPSLAFRLAMDAAIDAAKRPLNEADGGF